MRRLLGSAFELLNRGLRSRGFSIALTGNEDSRLKRQEVLCQSADIVSEYNELNYGTSCVIFSKDRPAQLDLLLRSIEHSANEFAQVHVIYRATNADCETGYGAVLARKYSIDHLQYINERSFRSDLIDLLDRLQTKHVMFLVDDIVFRNSLNLNSYTQVLSPWFSVLSPRLGRNTTHCYTRDKIQRLPVFTGLSSTAFLVWQWGEGDLDFGYPLSVDGHVFALPEIRAMIRLLDFKAPNSLEQSLQVFKPLFANRLGVCCEESVLVNIPNNRVQDEIRNRAEESDFGASLLLQWLSGNQISLSSFANVAIIGAHQAIEFLWEPRSL